MADGVNKKTEARLNAIQHWAGEWGLSKVQATGKFGQQCKKWQKKQVNRFVRELT